MKGIGVDMVDLRRLDISNQTFIKHILSDEEYAYFLKLSSDKRKLEFVGGRFAGKEAYLKAYHLGLGGKKFKDISILNDSDGSPYLNDPHALISISHEHNYAIAFVLIK